MGVMTAPSRVHWAMARPTIDGIFKRLGLSGHERLCDPREAGGDASIVVSDDPTTGAPLAGVRLDDAAQTSRVIGEAHEAFLAWRKIPAPKRGEVVRAIGDELRVYKQPLGELVSLEVGKSLPEGLGEVQETIDIADFAVGLSRQLHGITMPSERADHAMKEQWLPLGPIGVITAFNFPNAVWGWNAMLAAVCGDAVVWKPSLYAPLTAIATNDVCKRVCAQMGAPDIFKLIIGTDEQVGETMIADRRLPLISATGSCAMGRRVGAVVAQRLAKCLLELGGNNAVIVEPDADLDASARHVVFGAFGTAGQRCTTTRRLYVHKSISGVFIEKMLDLHKGVKVGDPLAQGVLVGPLINESSVVAFERAVSLAKAQGGRVLAGGSRATSGPASELGGRFVEPTIIDARAKDLPIAMEETFAPILYVFEYDTLDEAIAKNNSVDQGLSAAIMTGSSRSAERFLNPDGSGADTGLAYVNCGTSGAEIGGAFGGEKDTGGGRESGSDAWKIYMRRQTCTISFGSEFELAQGIRFD